MDLKMAEQVTIRRLVVWDGSGDTPVDRGTVCTWNSYAESDGVLSLLRYAEDHASDLRERYLAWVDELGESRVGRRRVVDHRAVGRTDFSVWWMSSIFEKSFASSPTMSFVVRILALDAIVSERVPFEVEVVSDRPEVRSAVRRLCSRHSVSCVSSRAGQIGCLRRVRQRLVRLVPRPVRAGLAMLQYVSSSRPALGRRQERWHDSGEALFFVSCFGYSNPGEAKEGRFDSAYWKGLKEVFEELGTPTNWLQYFVPTSDVPDLGSAVEFLARINANPDDQGTHAFVNAYLTPTVLIRVVLRWFSLLPSSLPLRALARRTFGPSIHAAIWPLVRGEWRDDLRGARSVHHLLWLGLFEAVCRDLPHQRCGLYLCEGVSWERAFVYAWRMNGHGRLVGVPHATVRFWDLRYYTDSRTRDRGGPYALPQPDLLVRNNVTARVAFAAVDVPESRIVDCEALRYAHLHDLERIDAKRGGVGILRVLVIGEFRPRSMAKMLQMLVAAAEELDIEMTFTVKSHLMLPIRAEDYPSLALKSVTAPLSEIVGDFDLAYSSNGTSAGVDVYLAGLPVVVWLDDDDINLSDLRGQPGVRFVSESADLVDAVRAVVGGEYCFSPPMEFFTLDPGLPRWRRLLAVE